MLGYVNGFVKLFKNLTSDNESDDKQIVMEPVKVLVATTLFIDNINTLIAPTELPNLPALGSDKFKLYVIRDYPFNCRLTRFHFYL